MSTIPENCPTNFCEEFTKQYLADIKEKKAWNTWHPIMERLLDRSIEMKPVYTELCDRFGYCLDGYSPELRKLYGRQEDYITRGQFHINVKFKKS